VAFFFPSNFRSGVLSLGREETADTTENDQKSAPQTIFAESNAPRGQLAHQLSTTAANSVIVIDKGIPIEQGSHDELITKGGVYASLIEKQHKC